MIDFEAVKKAVEDTDTEAVVRLFNGRSEADRHAIADDYLAFYAELAYELMRPVGRKTDKPSESAANLAMMACVPVTKLPNVPWFGHHEKPVAIILERSEEWIGEFIDAELKKNPDWLRWEFIRVLAEHGHHRPIHPGTYIRVMSYLRSKHDGPQDEPSDNPLLVQTLRAHNDLLNDVFWQIFEIDTIGGHAPDYLDYRYQNDTWSNAILILCKEGCLDRTRLLDASLEAYVRNIDTQKGQWCRDIFDLLKPTADELTVLSDLLYGLLETGKSKVMQWAFTKLTTAEKKDKCSINPKRYVTLLPDMLAMPAKGFIKKVVKLAGRLVEEVPEHKSEIGQAVSELFVREAPDIQEVVIVFFRKHFPEPDKSLQKHLEGFRDYIASSLRQQIDEYLGDANNLITENDDTPITVDWQSLREEIADIPSNITETTGLSAILNAIKRDEVLLPPLDTQTLLDAPRCIEACRLPTFETHDSIIEGLSEWIESPDDIIHFELLLGSMVTLCGEKPEDFRQKKMPLVKRTKVKMKEDRWVTSLELSCIIAWTSETSPTSHDAKMIAKFDRIPEDEKPLTIRTFPFFRHHLDSIIKRIRTRRPFILLSTPTHQGGWVDPTVLVDRWLQFRNTEEKDPIETDAILALLRLPHDSREEALDKLRNEPARKPTEFELALRYALGDDQVKIGKDIRLWAAAARARAPMEDDQRIDQASKQFDNDCARRVECCLKTYSGTNPYESYSREARRIWISGLNDDEYFSEHYDAEQEFPLGQHYCWPHQLIDLSYWSPTPRRSYAQWPAGTESYSLSAFRSMLTNIDWQETFHDNWQHLVQLLDPDFPLGQIASLLLATGLGCKHTTEHSMATDVAIAAIDDGRLTDENLGDALRVLFASRLVPPGRWQKTLGDVARASTLHAYLVQRAICQSLQGNKDDAPKNPAPYLELLVELTLSLGTSIEDEEARNFLAQFKGSSKAAKAAKTLLAQDGKLSAGKTSEIMQLAIEGRIARAQRWAG